jgi:hypothetical protein
VLRKGARSAPRADGEVDDENEDNDRDEDGDRDQDVGKG